ncbi:gasdermin-C-like [Sorex fumeus]|uniref:gasdermin-C-like n=1 Tax=Sorex fumeus TaxID=62283 RepID=UPI0024AD3055|nr:gasdermin-C-like [Sorex fumeus]
MVVLFDDAVKRLLRQVGKEDLKPVTDLKSAKKFHHFNVLRKKKNGFSSFWNPPDIPAGFSLLDILDQSTPVPDPSREGPFIYKDNMVWKGEGDVTIDAGFGAEMAASGGTNKSYESILKFQINEITTKTWTDLCSRALLKPEPWFLEQYRQKREDLYVVTETVEVTNSPQLRVESDRKWFGKFSIPQTPYIKGQGQVTGDKKREQLLTLPENMVMAYQTKQLIFKKDGWEILLIKDKKQMTFPDEDFQSKSLEMSITENRSEILPIQRIEKPLSQDFKQLQDEISRRMGELSQFSKNIQDILFHNILVMLGDREALQDLQDMMEQFPQGDLNGPGGIILNELRKNSEDSFFYAPYCIPYLLEALLVLNDTQRDLLAWSMEKKILVHQRELVRSILEPNFKYPWRIPFTLKPELLTPLKDEGVAVTYKLLEECGLKIDLNSNRSAWDLEAKMPLSALYGCLSLLQQLAVA